LNFPTRYGFLLTLPHLHYFFQEGILPNPSM